MASDLRRMLPSVNFSADNFVALENFRSQELESAHVPLPECCPVHPQMQLALFCTHCKVDICTQCVTTGNTHKDHEHIKIEEERQRLVEATGGVMELQEEMKLAIFEMKDMKKGVRNRKNNNITMTREAFATLRKAIDRKEVQTIVNIKETANEIEKALELQEERLLLLLTQLKNCLQLIKETNEKKRGGEELTKRRIIVEQRIDHLNKKRLEPVVSKQVEPQFENVEPLCLVISKLLFLPVDLSRCKVVIPPVVMKNNTKLMITLKDKKDDYVSEQSQQLTVAIKNIKDGEFIHVTPIKEVDKGRYETSFTPHRCGCYMISVIFDGCNIPGSPYKTPVDIDYHKITEQNCISKVVTHYGQNKFDSVYDVAVGRNEEILIVSYGKVNPCVVVLDNELNLLTVIGQGDGDSRLIGPNGVVMTDNVIAISDWGSHQVKKYSLQGELLSVIGRGCKGHENGQFNYPRGLAFNSSNKLLYVVDSENYRVQVFQEDNTFVFSFGNKVDSNSGQFLHPYRIEIDPSDRVLVTDPFVNTIHVFTPSGQIIQAINIHKPWGIAISPAGYLITGHDGNDNKIKVWSPTYQLITEFGNREVLFGIRGMAMDSCGNIYVAESGKQRLHVIKLL